MKKYILSALVVATFASYVLYQRMTGAPDMLAVAPAGNSNSTANSVAGDVTITPASTDTTNVPNPVATIPVSVPVPAPAKTPKSTPPASTPAPVKVAAGLYKDGQYTGISADAYYGNIQVAVTVSGGKITDVQFLDYPQDRSTSRRINTQAMPILRQEAISAQSSNVNTVSGASDSSGAFRQSLASALSQAKNA